MFSTEHTWPLYLVGLSTSFLSFVFKTCIILRFNRLFSMIKNFPTKSDWLRDSKRASSRFSILFQASIFLAVFFLFAFPVLPADAIGANSCIGGVTVKTVVSGTAVSLCWKTDNPPSRPSCTPAPSSGGFLGVLSPNINNSVTTNPLTNQTTFTIDCQDLDNLQAPHFSSSVAVTVVSPLSSTLECRDPVTGVYNQNYCIINYEDAVNLRWTTTGNPTTCAGTGAWSGEALAPASPGGSKTFTIPSVSQLLYTFGTTCSRP